MSRISRFMIVLVVLGGMLAFFGFQEWRVSKGSTAEPIAVELIDVEAGKAPENNHWKLGESVALYNACVYEYEQSKYSNAEPDGETKINYCLLLSHHFEGTSVSCPAVDAGRQARIDRSHSRGRGSGDQ